MDTDLKAGNNYFVRTVTDHWVGRLVAVIGPRDVVLEQAAWVADSGRFHAFLRDGRADNMEIELVPDGILTRLYSVSCILDWPFDLFREAV